MNLVSSFAKSAVKVGGLSDFLDEDTLREAIPAIFAEEPHSSRSERYKFIPTIDVLRGLAEDGFKPVFAAQSSPRDRQRYGHTKHLIRFRRESDVLDRPNECPEIVALNSHGGESRFQLFAGIFRFICLNSMVTGDTYADVRIKHSGRIVDDVREAAWNVVSSFGKFMGDVDHWRQLQLNHDEQHAFAASVAELRMGPVEQGKPVHEVDSAQFLDVRRPEDRHNDLWTVASRAQEHLVRGGPSGVLRRPNGTVRRLTLRPVNGIDQNIALNRALWTLTEKMAELKA